MKKAILAVSGFLSLFCSSLAVAQVATFDSGKNDLSLPALKIGSNYYNNVHISLLPGSFWQISNVGSRSAVSDQFSVYTPATAELFMPLLSIDGTRYANTSLTLSADQKWQVGKVGPRVLDDVQTSIFSSAGNMLTSTTFPIKGVIGQFCGIDASQASGSVPGLYEVSNPDGSAVAAPNNYWRTVSCSSTFGTVDTTTNLPVCKNNQSVNVYQLDATNQQTPLYLMTFSGFVPTCYVQTINQPDNVAALSVLPTTLQGKVKDVLTLSIQGGTPPYAQPLSVDSTVATVGTLKQPDSNRVQFTVPITLVKAGSSQIIIKDSRGTTLSVTVTVNPSLMSVTPTSVDGLVGDTSTFSITGGVGPYQISISRSAIATLQSMSASPDQGMAIGKLALNKAGTTQVVVTDSIGNLFSLPVTVGQSTNGSIFR